MGYLIASILALAVGPIAFRWAQSNEGKAVRTALELVVVLAVAGVVVFHIMPHCIEVLGWTAVVPLVVGLLGPTLVERWMHRLATPAHSLVRALVVLGVLLHEITDGVALAIPDAHAGHEEMALPAVVVLHRLLVGLVLWWLVRPRYGNRVATAVLVAVAVATVAGYGAGALILPLLENDQLMIFQTLVAGSLLHVVVHHRDFRHASH